MSVSTFNLSSGTYRILASGANPLPAGVNLFFSDVLPETVDVQLDMPIQNWVLENVDGGQHFAFNISRYSATGVIADWDPQIGEKVVASKDPQIDNVLWDVTYRPQYYAYTTERADQPGMGWEVLSGNSSKPYIVIREIKEPFVGQLFQFENIKT